MSNPYENSARLTKATKLAAVLKAEKWTLEQVRAASDQQRKLIAQIAGTRDPSDETWRTVIWMIEFAQRY